jgi:hypothetical protein
MIRNVVSKAFMMTAVTLLAGAMSVGCAKKDSRDDLGSIGLALTLPGGAIVNTVTYQITGNGITPINGTIDVSAPGTTVATALVTGLPAGSYSVTMNATASDGQTCAGTSPFTVVAGQTAMANVILQCSRISGNGTVVINGRLDQCPFITGLSATALQAPVGGSITVGVSATELDPGDTITYAWTNSAPAVGTLAPTNAATGTFTCTTAGSAVLSIAVSDGVCGDTLANAIPITCTAGTTGAAGAAGTGVAGAAGTGVAGAAGTGVAGAAGTGVAGAAGTGVAGAAGSGPVACIETNPPAAIAMACDACLDANQNPVTDGCCNIQSDSVGFQLCQTASACMRTGTVAGAPCNNSGDTGTCFCGTSGTACSTGGANGPCLAEITAAAGRNVVTGVTDSPGPAVIIQRYGSPEYAIGRAANIQSVAGAFCPAECGF